MEALSNKVQFPHILTIPLNKNNGQLRFVQPEEAEEGGVVYDPDRTQFNAETNQMELVSHVFRINSISEKREAKGDWSGWDTHPFYHDTYGSYLGRQFESNKGTSTFIK